jgi:8-oxo-dGTP pyrophosphatase MutT (NUDIX family)
MSGNWLTDKDSFIGNFKIFDLHKVIRKSQSGQKKGEFVYLNSPDWVNIIPITKKNKVVLIEQFRHGTNELTIEIPGGMIEQSEEPGSAGSRECAEETGYYSNSKPELLGIITPNPAFLNNRCYSFVWRDVEKTYEQNLDGNEEISVFEVSIDDVRKMIRDGKINHSLVLNAFAYLFLKDIE